MKSTNPLSLIIGATVKLSPGTAPHTSAGNCPRCDSPEFHVSDTAGFFYCFGCRWHGDERTFSEWSGSATRRHAVAPLLFALNARIFAIDANGAEPVFHGEAGTLAGISLRYSAALDAQPKRNPNGDPA